MYENLGCHRAKWVSLMLNNKLVDCGHTLSDTNMGRRQRRWSTFVYWCTVDLPQMLSPCSVELAAMVIGDEKRQPTLAAAWNRLQEQASLRQQTLHRKSPV